MKKIAFLLLFGFLATTGFAQLEVAVSHDGQNMDVQFPAGNLVEYKVALVDPITRAPWNCSQVDWMPTPPN